MNGEYVLITLHSVWLKNPRAHPHYVPNLQLRAVLLAHLPSRTIHHSANRSTHPPPTSLFLQPPPLLVSCAQTKPYPYHCIASLEWNATRTLHLLFTSTTVIANHKTSSVCHPGLFTRNWRSIKTNSYPDSSDHPSSQSRPKWHAP